MESIYKEYIEKYTKRLEKNNNDIEALINLARITFKEKKYKESSEYYEKINKITNGDNNESLYMLGIFSIKNGDNKKALEYFNLLIDKGIENPFVYEYISFIDNNNKMLHLRKSIKKNDAILIRKRDYNRLAFVAFYAFQNNLLDTALLYAISASKIKNTSEIANLLGCIYFSHNNLNNALSYFHEANTILKNQNPYVLANIASCYYKKNSHNMAIRYFEKASQLQSQNKNIFYNLGYIYANIVGNKKNAIEYLDKALEIDPNYQDAIEIKNNLNN